MNCPQGLLSHKSLLTVNVIYTQAPTLRRELQIQSESSYLSLKQLCHYCTTENILPSQTLTWYFIGVLNLYINLRKIALLQYEFLTNKLLVFPYFGHSWLFFKVFSILIFYVSSAFDPNYFVFEGILSVIFI